MHRVTSGRTTSASGRITTRQDAPRHVRTQRATFPRVTTLQTLLWRHTTGRRCGATTGPCIWIGWNWNGTREHVFVGHRHKLNLPQGDSLGWLTYWNRYSVLWFISGTCRYKTLVDTLSTAESPAPPNPKSSPPSRFRPGNLFNSTAKHLFQLLRFRCLSHHAQSHFSRTQQEPCCSHRKTSGKPSSSNSPSCVGRTGREELGLHLDLDSTTLEQLRLDFPPGVPDNCTRCAFRVFMAWMHRRTGTTLQELHDALLQAQQGNVAAFVKDSARKYVKRKWSIFSSEYWFLKSTMGILVLSDIACAQEEVSFCRLSCRRRTVPRIRRLYGVVEHSVSMTAFVWCIVTWWSTTNACNCLLFVL